MSKVLIVESSYETCADAVEKVFETFPVEIKNKKVCIKVNGLKAGDPHKFAYVTDYRLLAQIVKKVESLGPRELVVGDWVGTESYGKSDEVFEITHLSDAAGKYYRNLNKNLKIVEIEKPIKRKVAVLSDVIDADVYISVPKMKTHGLTRISGAVKNNYGLFTGAQKAWFHYKSITPERFAEAVIEAFTLRKPDLVIVDGIMAMEGYGPGSPEVNHVGKIISGVDSPAIDTVIANMIGFSVDDVPLLRICRDRKLGETDLSKIEVIGSTKLKQAYNLPDPPAASFSYKAGVGGGRTNIRFYRDRASYRPTIDETVCNSCEVCRKDGPICVKTCPSGALTYDQTFGWDKEKCLICCSCMEQCPSKALIMKPDPEILKLLEQQEKDLNYPVFD